MATRSLSPKQIAERMQRHRRAVMVLALQRAKAAVLAQIRADGQKIGQFSAKGIRQLQEDYFAANMEQLITKAVADIATSPLFAYLRTNAQKENGPKSITSAVQMSGAK